MLFLVALWNSIVSAVLS